MRRIFPLAPIWVRTAILLALALLVFLVARETPEPAHDVPGVADAHLDPRFWARHLRQPDRIVLTPAQIAAQNARMQAEDPSFNDIEHLPPTLEAEQVRAWIERVSVPPVRTLYDATGQAGSEEQVERIVDNLGLESMPQTQVTRYGMVVRRADLRTFPTRLRVFHEPGDNDIDRFQETALFPGTPVAIVHESRDRVWYFVVGPNYAAWIERQYVAQGDKDAILAYGRREPFLVVTGATERTAFTPENPAVSTVPLDMGVRLPLLADWPGDREVNGQHPLASHVVELPVRNEDGSLSFSPALVPRSADVSIGYLPLTRGNLLRQSFKFLGERYGWGHSYGARDCSGFVSEVYRSFGVLLPRNTGDQAVSPALNRIAVTGADDRDRRLRVLRETRVGDLVYVPGHVMMVVGHLGGEPYAIHDTNGMTLHGADGGLRRLHLNGVVVTPILPMLSDTGVPMVDRVTSLQRIRP